jgi:hypothetical protein
MMIEFDYYGRSRHDQGVEGFKVESRQTDDFSRRRYHGAFCSKPAFTMASTPPIFRLGWGTAESFVRLRARGAAMQEDLSSLQAMAPSIF